MALSTIGFTGAISESQEARRWWLAGLPAARWTNSDLSVTPGSGRAVKIAKGWFQVCGVACYNNAEETVAIPSSSVARRSIVAARVTWSGKNSSVTFVLIQGPSGGTQYPSLQQTPGVVYEAPIAVLDTRANFSSVTTSQITMVLPYGGRGGPLQVPTDKYLGIVPAHMGAIIEAESNRSRWQRQSTGTVKLSEVGTPWKFFDPKIRYAGGGNIQAAEVNLGNGGIRRGRYKIMDGWVVGDIEIRTGTSGSYWGTGGLTIDCPPGLGFDRQYEDRWMEAHMYTTAEEPMDWACQVLGRAGKNHMTLWAPRHAGDCRLWIARASNPATLAKGTGVPIIASTFTVPQVITVQLLYSVEG